MKKLFSIQSPHQRRDESGQMLDEWQEVGKEWFELRGATANESQRGNQMEATVTHVGRCHFFQGSNSSMRITKDGRVLEAVGPPVNENEDNRWLVWNLAEVN